MIFEYQGLCRKLGVQGNYTFLRQHRLGMLNLAHYIDETVYPSFIEFIGTADIAIELVTHEVLYFRSSGTLVLKHH